MPIHTENVLDFSLKKEKSCEHSQKLHKDFVSNFLKHILFQKQLDHL